MNLLLSFDYILSNASAQVISGSEPSPPQLPSIKIMSHITGQQVPIGPLTISGTSTDTSSTECQVYADWNDKKPYQKARATGPGGKDDYSKWTYTYGAGYHLIGNGTNNLTTKVSCLSVPMNLTKWYSIDVVGVPVTTNSTLTDTIPIENFGGGSTNNIPQIVPKNSMAIDLHLEKNRVAIGEEQTLVITVSNAAEISQKITLASANVTVTYSGSLGREVGPLVEYSSNTDEDGEMTYTWEIGPRFTAGEYLVSVGVTAPGYRPTSGATIFEVEESGIED